MVYAFLRAFPLYTPTADRDYMITSELALPVHVSQRVDDGDEVLLGKQKASSYLQGSQDCNFPLRLYFPLRTRREASLRKSTICPPA